jgi:hypothetical protein
VTPYPVHYLVHRPESFTRFQLLVRLAASIALGVLGISLGAVFLATYLALPVYAAVRLGRRTPEDYLREDAPQVVRFISWIAAVFAWFGLVTDRLPVKEPDEDVRVVVAPVGTPSPASALWRVLLGGPSALVLAVLACVGGFVWLWAVLCVLVSERVGASAHAYMAGVQRWGIRLLAYQASLVDVYPPFAFDDQVETPQAASAG